MIFLINGILEMMFGLQVCFVPHTTMQVKKMLKANGKLDAAASIYAKKLGPLIFSFALVSIYMHFEPFSNAKGLFTVGWIMYHFSVIYDNIKTMESFDSFGIVHTITHSVLSTTMVGYLYQNQFQIINVLLFPMPV